MVGSAVSSVTLTINRCLPMRYSAAVMLKTSVRVTVGLGVTGAESTPAELMALIVRVTTVGVAGALKDMVAEVGPVGVTHKFPCVTPPAQPLVGNSRVPAGACVTVKVSGVSPVGSEPVTSMLTFTVFTGTEMDATGL